MPILSLTLHLMDTCTSFLHQYSWSFLWCKGAQQSRDLCYPPFSHQIYNCPRMMLSMASFCILFSLCPIMETAVESLKHMQLKCIGWEWECPIVADIGNLTFWSCHEDLPLHPHRIPSCCCWSTEPRWTVNCDLHRSWNFQIMQVNRMIVIMPSNPKSKFTRSKRRLLRNK